MAILSLRYPVTPHVVTRPWGVSDRIYERFGFRQHNGIDLLLKEGQPIHAPLPCRVTKIGYQPLGSGHYICLLSEDAYHFEDGKKCRVEVTFMHLQKSAAKIGDHLMPGMIAAYGGNSGFSTGTHTHMALKRVRITRTGYRAIDRNQAANTIDPQPYWENARTRPHPSALTEDRGYQAPVVVDTAPAAQVRAVF